MSAEPTFTSAADARLFLVAHALGGLGSFVAAVWLVGQDGVLSGRNYFSFGVVAGAAIVVAHVLLLKTQPGEGNWFYKMHDPGLFHRHWSRETWDEAVRSSGIRYDSRWLRRVSIVLWLSLFLVFPIVMIQFFNREGVLTDAAVYGVAWVTGFMVAGLIFQWRWSAWFTHLRKEGLVVEEESLQNRMLALFRYWPLSFKPDHDPKTEELRRKAAASTIVFLCVWLGGLLAPVAFWVLAN